MSTLLLLPGKSNPTNKTRPATPATAKAAAPLIPAVPVEVAPISTEPAPEATAEPKPEFHIDSEDRANWLLRKLAQNTAEAKRVKAQAEAMIGALKSENDRLLFRFEKELREWAEAELLRRKSRIKTLRTLQGNLAFRTCPKALRIMDAQAATEKARELGLIVTVEQLDAAGYRDAAERQLQETGELLPGVEVEEAKESFKISFGKEE
jgi:hypothetical protein